MFPFGFFVNDSQMAPNPTSFGCLSRSSFIAAIVRSSGLLVRVQSVTSEEREAGTTIKKKTGGYC